MKRNKYLYNYTILILWKKETKAGTRVDTFYKHDLI